MQGDPLEWLNPPVDLDLDVLPSCLGSKVATVVAGIVETKSTGRPVAQHEIRTRARTSEPLSTQPAVCQIWSCVTKL